MNFSLGIAIGYFEKDDIINAKLFLDKFFNNNEFNENDKNIKKYKSLIKNLFYKKLFQYIKGKNYEKAVLILECFIQYLDEKEYENSKFWEIAGTCFRNFKSLDCAIDCYLKSINLKSFNPDVFRLIGDIYYFDKNEKEKSIEFYEKYTEHVKDNPYVYNMLGHLYESLYKSEFQEKQEKYFEKAHKLNPEIKEFLNNLTLVAGKNKQTEKFIQYSEEILKNNPTQDNYYDYACWGLYNKLFDVFHKYFFSRFFKEKGKTEYPNVMEKLWNGKDDLTDKILLVRYEQGFGDTIMFSRFLAKLKGSAKKIIFKVQPQLFSLIEQNFTDIIVIPDTKQYENIEYDYQIPLMELFTIFKITDKSIPLKDKYLSVSEEKISKFGKANIKENKFNIGIAFCGKEDYAGDNRDIPADIITELADIPNVQLYSLQVNNNQDLIKCERYKKIVDFQKILNNFETTAAAIENMDLIVTTDNVILNLSAALGKKTFGIFNYYTDYRWFKLEENDSGWYNSIKVYQNKRYDDWKTTFKTIYSDVEELVLKSQ